MPAIEFWFRGLTWVVALGFFLALLRWCLEAREMASAKPTVRLILSTAIMITVGIAWWSAAVREAKGPRRLTNRQATKIIKAAKEACPIQPIVMIVVNHTDSEAMKFAVNLGETIAKGGCNVKIAEEWSPLSPLKSGISIMVRDSFENHKGIKSMSKLLSAAKLKFDVEYRSIDKTKNIYDGAPFVLAIYSRL
ncbi:MAG: hypothetical protein HYY96_14255 [Candidatus Tectomicrobia bacterium]|nr:hypothetical protein [Candidatus Tectomicrobia bacterium]